MIARSKNHKLKHKLGAIYLVRGPKLKGTGKVSARVTSWDKPESRVGWEGRVVTAGLRYSHQSSKKLRVLEAHTRTSGAFLHRHEVEQHKWSALVMWPVPASGWITQTSQITCFSSWGQRVVGGEWGIVHVDCIPTVCQELCRLFYLFCLLHLVIITILITKKVHLKFR